VLTISSFQGGYTTNVIPSEVKLMGTFRAMDESWRFQAHKLIHRICKGIAQAMGAEIDVLVDVGYPVVNNDEQLYPIARSWAEEYAGRENILETEVRMGSEDFGFYTQEIPGCFYRLGVMNEAKGITSGVHTPTFNIDESAIEKGMGMMAWLGVSIYNGQNPPQ
jgi:hippurate hydrolase